MRHRVELYIRVEKSQAMCRPTERWKHRPETPFARPLAAGHSLSAPCARDFRRFQNSLGLENCSENKVRRLSPCRSYESANASPDLKTVLRTIVSDFHVSRTFRTIGNAQDFVWKVKTNVFRVCPVPSSPSIRAREGSYNAVVLDVAGLRKLI
jgi:hypothetical protein